MNDFLVAFRGQFMVCGKTRLRALRVHKQKTRKIASETADTLLPLKVMKQHRLHAVKVMIIGFVGYELTLE